jgi:hypothetical protein
VKGPFPVCLLYQYKLGICACSLTTRHTEVAGQHDKLKKIWWYLDYLDKKFTYNFIPNENVTIDESMIKFKVSNNYVWMAV